MLARWFKAHELPDTKYFCHPFLSSTSKNASVNLHAREEEIRSFQTDVCIKTLTFVLNPRASNRFTYVDLKPQVLQALQRSSADSLEACILECPAGLQALVEVLRDPREEVRNEVILFMGQVSKICVRCYIEAGETCHEINSK